MERYDYLAVVKDDVRNYIIDEVNLSEFGGVEELNEFLNEKLFNENSVTGNSSYTYTYNREVATENLLDNMDLLSQAMDEFGNVLDKGEELCDVTIRCYLLPQAINEVLDDYEIDGLSLEEYFENKE